MHDRRDALKFGMMLMGGASASTAARASGSRQVPQSGMVFPDTGVPSIVAQPSPPVVPFQDPLYQMPAAQPLPMSALQGPAPDPARHQRYNDFIPQKFYQQVISEFRWRYSGQAPYGNGATGYDPTGQSGSWHWGFNNGAPGETFHARYGEPVLVRRINNLPPVGDPNRKALFPLPSITLHLHNAHTASESDGLPMDFFDPGEFWDYHYGNFPAGFDAVHETMSTLWYHDHRLDFTATNVYAGLSGFYLLFDDKDTGNELDGAKGAFRLPSGKYDVPLIFHDVMFDANGQVVWDFFMPNPVNMPGEDVSKYGTDPYHPLAPGGSPLGSPNQTNNQRPMDEPAILPAMQRGYTLKGMIGDRYTVNRTIQPYLDVEPRKYRFRLLNGGPSRLYRFSLHTVESGISETAKRNAERFFVISTDGNFLEEPVVATELQIYVAERHDVIVDFSAYSPGDKIRLMNHMGMREDGAGPNGRDVSDEVMEFRVVAGKGPDKSRIPDVLRPLPPINMSEVRRRRLFVFDYDNGLWTINGKLMDPNRIDAKIEQGSAEIWTFRNAGNSWAHPVHTHFEEFQILEVNGRSVRNKGNLLRTRKDVVALGPQDEVTFFGRWRDFLGKHVMHCHNVVHEDHAMMIRWDIVPPGQGD